jgi:hypothetical protein
MSWNKNYNKAMYIEMKYLPLHEYCHVFQSFIYIFFCATCYLVPFQIYYNRLNDFWFKYTYHNENYYLQMKMKMILNSCDKK